MANSSSSCAITINVGALIARVVDQLYSRLDYAMCPRHPDVSFSALPNGKLLKLQNSLEVVLTARPQFDNNSYERANRIENLEVGNQWLVHRRTGNPANVNYSVVWIQDYIMAGRHGQRAAGFHIGCLLHKLLQVCNRGGRRRIVCLGCLFVAAVVVVYLPVIFHAQTGPVTVRHVHAHKNSKVHSMDTAFADSNVFSQFALDNVFRYSHFSEMFLNTSLEEDIYLNSLCERRIGEEMEREAQPVSLILSLRNVATDTEAIYYIKQQLQMVPSSLTEDVIITLEKNVLQMFKETIEEFVDLCPVCRLLFLSGNVYKHWNEAAKFARSKYLVFIDARVFLAKNSLKDMIRRLQSEEKTVVSPQLRLKYADGRGQNVGLSRNEVTWDLGVSRGAVSYQLLRSAQNLSERCINQTVISKEVFGIGKQFFTELGGFDLLPDVTGGEQVSFSLKVLNCRGKIVTCLCSTACLTIANTAGTSDIRATVRSSEYVDFHNPTFDANLTNISAYYIAASRPWLDTYTARFYSCSLRRIPSTDFAETRNKSGQTATAHRHGFDLNRYMNSRYGFYGYSLKQNLVKSKCYVGNFRYFTSRRQPQMLPPTKAATFYGYIRTIDGMYAFGRSTETPVYKIEPEQRVNIRQEIYRKSEFGTFVLTRNASLWTGPFSYINGAFVYNNVWCLTVSSKLTLFLQKCIKGDANQLFSFSNNIITLLGLSAQCVGSRRSSDISSLIVLSPCSEGNRLIQFKLDVQFIEKCVK